MASVARLSAQSGLIRTSVVDTAASAATEHASSMGHGGPKGGVNALGPIRIRSNTWALLGH